MHEIELLRRAIDVALECAEDLKATHIERVNMRIGAEAGVDLDVVRLGFQAVTRGTLAEGATFEIEPVPVRCRCPSCGDEFEPRDELHECPRCGRAGVLVTGREFNLATIDIV